MPCAVVLALLLAAPPPSFAERVEGERAVERARYAFVIGATKPFDEVYPRAVFEKKVRRELAEERVLSRQFGMEVTPALLAAEYERIERETRAPEQWAAIKAALGGSREKVEEVFCRPLLVARVLRARFAFDQAIHAREHRKARTARALFLAGKAPPGMTRLRLSRHGEAGGTQEMLARAKADAAVPKLLSSPSAERVEDRPLALAPEMVAVLEKELKVAGDVTTILEEQTRFSVFRLLRSDAQEWVVDAVVVPKLDFDRWLATVRGPARR